MTKNAVVDNGSAAPKRRWPISARLALLNQEIENRNKARKLAAVAEHEARVEREAQAKRAALERQQAAAAHSVKRRKINLFYEAAHRCLPQETITPAWDAVWALAPELNRGAAEPKMPEGGSPDAAAP
jgi:hypothetical protein